MCNYHEVLKCQEIILFSEYIILLASLIYFWRRSRDPKDPSPGSRVFTPVPSVLTSATAVKIQEESSIRKASKSKDKQ